MYQEHYACKCDPKKLECCWLCKPPEPLPLSSGKLVDAVLGDITLDLTDETQLNELRAELMKEGTFRTIAMARALLDLFEVMQHEDREELKGLCEAAQGPCKALFEALDADYVKTTL